MIATQASPHELRLKYDEIHEKGLQEFIHGDTKPFPGFDLGPNSEHHANLIMSVVLNTDENQRWVRLMADLQEFQDYFALFIAGSEIAPPLHVTVMQAKGGLCALEELQYTRFDGANISFDGCIFDPSGANVLLVGTNIHPHILELRKIFQACVARCGGTPVPIGIQHSTLLRIGRFDNSIERRPKMRREFAAMLRRWHNEMCLVPLKFSVDRLLVSSVSGLLSLRNSKR